MWLFHLFLCFVCASCSLQFRVLDLGVPYFAPQSLNCDFSAFVMNRMCMLVVWVDWRRVFFIYNLMDTAPWDDDVPFFFQGFSPLFYFMCFCTASLFSLHLWPNAFSLLENKATLDLIDPTILTHLNEYFQLPTSQTILWIGTLWYPAVYPQFIPWHYTVIYLHCILANI